MPESTALARLDKARQMLALAQTLTDVKKIKVIADAVKAATRGQDIANDAAEISLAAQRCAGDIAESLKRATKAEAGAQKAHTSEVHASEYQQALEESHTPRETARKWQKLAAVPQPVFNEYVKAQRAAKQDITAVGLLKAVPKPAESEPVHEPIQMTASEVAEAVTKYLDAQVRDLSDDDKYTVYRMLVDELANPLTGRLSFAPEAEIA